VTPGQPQGAELEVLKVLWERGPGTVRTLNDALHARGFCWAYTTVQTMLQRLRSKGFVRCEQGRPANTFVATLSRQAALKARLRYLADQFCGGAAAPLLLALVEGGGLSEADVRGLRQLLDDLESPGATFS
jgi:predicted transcriptional regulator